MLVTAVYRTEASDFLAHVLHSRLLSLDLAAFSGLTLGEA